VQQKGRPVHSNWEKAQEYCRVENVPEDTRLLELGWMTEEVIVTYIECKWCRKKGIHREDNRGQGVLRERKLEEAEQCRCSRQKKKGGEVAHPMEKKHSRTVYRQKIQKV